MDTTIQEIVLESLKGELQSADLYLAVAETAPSEGMKHLAQQFATEEEKIKRAVNVLNEIAEEY